LFCRNTLAATTGAAPLTPAGDAEIEQVIAAPAVCDNPDVLVRISTNGVVSRWIAATSLT
jgi:hypothetical protein